jgi:hypothetical protein
MTHDQNVNDAEVDHIAEVSKMVSNPIDEALEMASNHAGDATEKVGQKFDADKPRFDLIPPRAERLLAKVLTFGAKKYAPGNWQHVEDAETRYIAAALRHINAYRVGEHSDPETGLPHLAHAMCSLAFVLELDEHAEMERAG